MIKQDLLWKCIIEDLFDDFLWYFFPDYAAEVDMTKGFEFLDKELQKIYPEGKSKNRRADLLAKVFLKDGTEQWILIHIEVQGYVDEEFPMRMFIYNYRSLDKLGNPKIASIAILTDDDKDYHPKYYEYQQWTTKLRYEFETYKLLDKKLSDFEPISNPFSLVMKTAWYGLKKNALKSDEDLLNLKIKLIRELLTHNYPKIRIKHILNFLNYYTTFSQPIFYKQLEQEVLVMNKYVEPMTTTEMVKRELTKIVKRQIKEEGIEEGIQKGREEGIQKGIQKGIEEGIQKGREEAREEARKIEQKKSILGLLNKGLSIEKTADLLDYSIEFVKSTKAEADLKAKILFLLKAEKSISFIAEQLKIEETYVLEVENEFNQE